MIETFPMIDWTVSALWIQQCSLSEAASGVVLAVSAAGACCSAGHTAHLPPAQRLPSRGAGRPPTGHSEPGAGPGFAISELQRLQKKTTTVRGWGRKRRGESHPGNYTFRPGDTRPGHWQAWSPEPTQRRKRGRPRGGWEGRESGREGVAVSTCDSRDSAVNASW